MLDSTGTPAPSSPVAQLSTNPFTGTTTLNAGSTAGTIYLTYLIDDGVYTYGDQSGPATTNGDLSGTAVVPVTVNYRPFAGTIAVTDSLTGYVGDPALTISESLTAVASDLTGLQVDRHVTWQAQELPSTGIQMVDNKITFTARGTFHVRAVVDGVYSPWVAVTALPKCRLASLAITDPVKVLTVTLTKGGSATVDLTQLPLVAKDQYGDPVDLASSTWVPTGTGLSVQGTTLTITAPGSYSLSLTSDAIRSNSLPVRATLVKRQVRFNTAGGTEVAPVTVPDGKIVWHGTYTTTRLGYTFTGWYADASLTTRVRSVVMTADATVYAGWR
ncbi:MAG: InlB B-repeat-containing protein [Actinobacteria bacterium]|nr:InlB B-repeat-containing protein [Actinomycetota bacterium]